MNIEKIEINGHYVWVDVNAEIKEGDWFLPISGTGWELNKPRQADNNGGYNNDHCKKVIAASPELNLEGVPDYLEWMSEKTRNEINEVAHLCSGEIEEHIFDCGFIYGYQTRDKELNHLKGGELFTSTADNVLSIQREQPTWDDVRKAIDIVHNLYSGKPYLTTEEIIEQLKQNKI